MDYKVGDSVKTKKTHPCGSNELGNNKSWP